MAMFSVKQLEEFTKILTKAAYVLAAVTILCTIPGLLASLGFDDRGPLALFAFLLAVFVLARDKLQDLIIQTALRQVMEEMPRR